MHQNDIEKLQKLLSIKNLEQPSPFYFDSVVSSFHRRLEAREARADWFSRLVEFLDFSPKIQFAAATAMACVMAVGIFTIQRIDSTVDQAPPGLLQLNAAQPSQFVNDHADELFHAQNAENIRELILTSNVMADIDPVKTSYVLDVQPVSYENGLSF